MQAALDGFQESVGFLEARFALQPRFPNLCLFAGGMTAVHPGMARVESDFSVIGREKDECRSALVDFSLEGIMHAKQFKKIQSLRCS